MNAKFGFSSFRIDNTFVVYTCKIMVEEPKNPPVFTTPGIMVKASLISKTTKKKGFHTVSRYTIRYTTTDHNHKNEMQKEIAAYLRDTAVAKLQNKWSWVEKGNEDIPALSAETLPADWEMELH